MYGERVRHNARGVPSGIPLFSIFYCGCKQPKSIHIGFIGCKGTKKMKNEK